MSTSVPLPSAAVYYAISSLTTALAPIEQHIVTHPDVLNPVAEQVLQLMDGITKGEQTLGSTTPIDALLPAIYRIGNSASQVLAIAQRLPLPPQVALAMSIANMILPALAGISAAIQAHNTVGNALHV